MRVLLAEDPPNVASYVKQGLEEQGYIVDLVHSGRKALELAQGVNFDLIILDIMLLELDGLTICRTLRQQGNQTALLMLTARDTVDDRVAGLDAGADDYLVKPFAFQELLARLRALTRRHPAKTTTFTLADLSLDPQTHVVMRSNRLIKLTPKEYAVLECLMRDANRIFSRTELAEAVGSHLADSQSNLVDVYIGNLRRKIDDPFALKLIHTMRGSGYYLASV